MCLNVICLLLRRAGCQHADAKGHIITLGHCLREGRRPFALRATRREGTAFRVEQGFVSLEYGKSLGAHCRRLCLCGLPPSQPQAGIS